jgi:hypothetical protein
MHPEHRLDPIAQDQIGEADDAVGDANGPVAAATILARSRP